MQTCLKKEGHESQKDDKIITMQDAISAVVELASAEADSALRQEMTKLKWKQCRLSAQEIEKAENISRI